MRGGDWGFKVSDGTIYNARTGCQTRQAAVGVGQILVTHTVFERTQSDLPGSKAKQYQLKGFEAPIELYEA